MIGSDSQELVDPLKLTPLSSKDPEYETQEDVMPLSKYKFDRSRLVVIKRNPKHRKTLVGGVEKVVMDGFEESTLWDIFVLDVARVGVETSIVIARIALTGKS